MRDCHIRRARPGDAESIAEIYNQGISEGIATFETDLRSTGEILAWFDERYPLVVAECSNSVSAFARASEYSPRSCYSGIAEFSVYVRKGMRRAGIGTEVMKGFIEECRRCGYRKLISRVFTENLASLNMLRNVGFREVGVFEKHGRIGSQWKDVVIVEYLIG